MQHSKARSPDELTPPPQWLVTSHKHSVSEPITSLHERTVSPNAELLAPLPKKTSRPPSEIDEYSVDDREYRTHGLLKPIKSHSNLQTGKGPPDLNDLKETPL